MGAATGSSSSSSSFGSARAYALALLATPRRVARRAPALTAPEREIGDARALSGADMRRSLRWYDLVCFGVGGMVGAGVFVVTGHAAHDYAGPAVVVSYVVAGLAALLSALCYTEFAVAVPAAGGAFSYLRTTLGEFAAFVVGANLVMEYVTSNAAVARSFTSYVLAAVGVADDGAWRFRVAGLPGGFDRLDPLAVGVVLFVTAVICYGTKDSSFLNMAISGVHVAALLFIIAMGFALGDRRNVTTPASPESAPGFAPFGVRGVLNGAAVVYFGYIGYDAVSTMAEEVRYPATDIPVGVCGSVAVVSVLYCLLAFSLAWLVPYDAIDDTAPFPRAFRRTHSGMGWVSNVVGGVAAMGILTSLMVSMIGQSRYLCVIGRTHVVPRWFAKVHPCTATPVNATVTLGLCTAAIALFTELAVLLNLISIGTLFVFYAVAAALIWRRYVLVPPKAPAATRATASYLMVLSAASASFAWFWQSSEAPNVRKWGLGLSTVVVLSGTTAFWWFVPQARRPASWGVPFMPWLPATSVFLNIFLLGSLDRASYLRFAVFSAVAVAVYLLYSVHATFDAEERRAHAEIDASGDSFVHSDAEIEIQPAWPSSQV